VFATNRDEVEFAWSSSDELEEITVSPTPSPPSAAEMASVTSNAPAEVKK